MLHRQQPSPEGRCTVQQCCQSVHCSKTLQSDTERRGQVIFALAPRPFGICDLPSRLASDHSLEAQLPRVHTVPYTHEL